ncbi:hypothetical protein CRYUN_Cryun15aG0050400 [Craigia yunnanensis]
MAKRQTILTCLMWLLVVSSITLCANATAGARLGSFEQGVHPQAGIAVAAAFSLGNRSCFAVGKYVVLMVVAVRTDASVSPLQQVFKLIAGEACALIKN